MTLALSAAAPLPATAGKSLAELTIETCRDYGKPAPGCWHNAADRIIKADFRRDEVDPLLAAMVARADTGDVRPDWNQILPLLLPLVDVYYQHGSRAAPTFAALVDKLGRAANAAK